MTASSRVSIQTEDFDLNAEVLALRSQDARVGAVCAFVGTVRDRNDGQSVSTMELEHYPGMTEKAIEAMIDVNDQLKVWKAQQVSQGWTSAEDIGETVAGKSAIVHRYFRAIASTVQADVAEKYRDWDNTRAGDYRGQGEDEAADDFRRNARWAVSDILGKPRNVVELL